MRTQTPRPTLGLCGLLVAALVVGGCTSSGDDGNGPGTAADLLVQGLIAKDVTDVPWSTEASAIDLPTLLGPLADTPVAVEVTNVEASAGSGTATLAWSWSFEGHDWTYESQAQLEEGSEEWQVEWAPSILEPSLVAGETLDVDTLPAQRGDIIGAGGRRLVTDRDVVRYGLDKVRIKPAQVADSARRIAQVLDIDAASYVKSAKQAGAKAFVEALVLRREDTGEVGSAYAEIPGAAAITDQIPLAPTREFAAPILGSVGPATAEIIEKSDGAIRDGDVVGLSGLQARYDDTLRGTPGLAVQAVDSEGTERQLYSYDPVDGTPLKITLEERLQLKAERILAGFEGGARNATAIVALRPSTGDVLAAANGPGAQGNNIATYGQYAPGSTFKIVSSLALLRSGLTPQSPVDCPATLVVDGKRFKNYDDYPSTALGRITLREAVANSCNTAIIGAGSRLPRGALADAAAALGLGVDHDLGFPAYFGQVPAPASETEAAADLIGQGKVLASPLAMAAVAASVRNGRAVLPRLIPAVDTTQTAPATPLTKQEAGQLQELMRAVVTEGSGNFLAGLPGDVGAKTGTAEYGEPAADGSLPTHTWMIATQGDLAVAVFVETGESGSGTAGPLLEAFLR
ncbi:penicillin-binding transpeptidase domain-containing protein [Nocardioides sp.]|uniref:penicillin-binding transpeptidase domain-containing protein n=1 Tax=Nocardioides sp. TaxID=35761 RepID=UPI003D0FA18C